MPPLYAIAAVEDEIGAMGKEKAATRSSVVFHRV